MSDFEIKHVQLKELCYGEDEFTVDTDDIVTMIKHDQEVHVFYKDGTVVIFPMWNIKCITKKVSTNHD